MPKRTFFGILLAVFVPSLLIVGTNFNVTKAVDYGGSGTTVGGIIWENTTWTLENSPYIVADTVQIPANVTLTIEPGVTVTKTTGDDMFLLNGIIRAHGTAENMITFDGGGNSNFFAALSSTGDTFLDLNYCIIRNGRSLFPSSGHAHLNITHSKIENIDEPCSLIPERDSFIEYNIFKNFCSFVAGSDWSTIYIRYNLFVGRSSFSNDEYYTIKCIGPGLIVKHNSFLDNHKVLQLYPGFSSAAMTAMQNYWGTLNTSLIDSMIYDRNDDITCADFIDYLPILFEPHPDTPKILSTIYVDDDNTAGPWDGTVEHPYQNITQGLDHTLMNDTIFVYNGTYYENVVVNKTIYFVGENRDSTIIDARGSGDVLRIEADNVTVCNFTVRHAGDYGVVLYGSAVMRNNIITDNRLNGIEGFVGGNIIEGSLIENNWVGVEFFSEGNIIANNTIKDNANYGVSMYAGHNTIQANEIVNHPSEGISLRDSSYNWIARNSISNNGFCIRASTSVGNNITENAFFDSALFFDGGNNNKIWHNNFINSQPTLNIAFNIWDESYPSGGNYWSDYAGIDLLSGSYRNETGSDCIGDTPYILDENNIDYYPLMDQWSPLPKKKFDIVMDSLDFLVSILSNSTVSHFTFDQSQAQIRFKITGEIGTTGYCNIFTPKELLWGEFSVYKDGFPLVKDVDYTQTYNGTHYIFYINYVHTTHTIEIQGTEVIPEFPPAMILPLFITATLLAVIIYRRKHST